MLYINNSTYNFFLFVCFCVCVYVPVMFIIIIINVIQVLYCFIAIKIYIDLRSLKIIKELLTCGNKKFHQN